MKKRKKESPRKLTENTSPRAKKSCKKFFSKNAKNAWKLLQFALKRDKIN